MLYVRGSVVGIANSVTPHYLKRPFGTLPCSPEGTFKVVRGEAPIRRIKRTPRSWSSRRGHYHPQHWSKSLRSLVQLGLKVLDPSWALSCGKIPCETSLFPSKPIKILSIKTTGPFYRPKPDVAILVFCNSENHTAYLEDLGEFILGEG